MRFWKKTEKGLCVAVPFQRKKQKRDLGALILRQLRTIAYWIYTNLRGFYNNDGRE